MHDGIMCVLMVVIQSQWGFIGLIFVCLCGALVSLLFSVLKLWRDVPQRAARLQLLFASRRYFLFGCCTTSRHPFRWLN